MDYSHWPYFDPDFESLIQRIHPPRVCVDNDTCEDCTLVKVDSANKHGILLEMVQVLTDLDLVISKSYVSSDGDWLMDVFHVTDQLGNKVTDERLIHYIQQSLDIGRGGSMREVETCLGRLVRAQPADEHTALELTGADRPGLLSEFSAVLAELNCNVVAAQAWTHKKRVACIVYVTEHTTGGPIDDVDRLADVENQLANVWRAHCSEEWGRVSAQASLAGLTHTERRLHQMMFADGDYERSADVAERAGSTSAHVSIDHCSEKGYSVVSVRSKDRPKLLFDTVCTLTDMQYVVFHAAISSNGPLAIQEYYIRHVDGCTLDTEGERQHVMKCLEAAIERRVSHGLRLDVCTCNRLGLLSDITRILRKNGLSVSNAEIATRGDKAIGSFYVTDASGDDVDAKAVEPMVREIGGCTVFEAKGLGLNKRSRGNSSSSSNSLGERPRFSLGGLLWTQLERFSSNFSSSSSMRS